jgi:predicted nicotinamide N-methyase
MKSIEAFARKGEKGILKNMFKGSDSEDVSSCDSSEEDEIASAQRTTNLDFAELDVSSGSEKAETTYISLDNSFRVLMHQQREKGIAHQLWPAASLLSNFLEKQLNLIVPNPATKSLLELGAGIGLCGIVCSYLGFKNVILTDLPVAMDLLKENIELNEPLRQNHFVVKNESPDSTKSSSSGSLISADVLSWGNNEELDLVMQKFEEPPLVIAADCVYWEHLFEPLFITVRELVARGCEVIICHVKRWKKDEKFFKMCRKCMTVELLSEVKDMIPAENTGIPQRRISRILRIKASPFSSSSSSS